MLHSPESRASPSRIGPTLYDPRPSRDNMRRAAVSAPGARAQASLGAQQATRAVHPTSDEAGNVGTISKQHLCAAGAFDLEAGMGHNAHRIARLGCLSISAHGGAQHIRKPVTPSRTLLTAGRSCGTAFPPGIPHRRRNFNDSFFHFAIGGVRMCGKALALDRL